MQINLVLQYSQPRCYTGICVFKHVDCCVCILQEYREEVPSLLLEGENSERADIDRFDSNTDVESQLDRFRQQWKDEIRGNNSNQSDAEADNMGIEKEVI